MKKSVKKAALIVAMGGLMSANVWSQNFENFASVNVGYENTNLSLKNGNATNSMKMNGFSVGGAYNLFITGGLGVEAGLNYSFAFLTKKL